ncbi:MAG: ribosome biogenesis factor YjgA [Burkholderiaceae bacterium]
MVPPQQSSVRGTGSGLDESALGNAPQSPVSEPERPSKTRRKQASHDLQALGVALVELPDHRLQELAIPDRLLEALLAYKGTRSHEGRRRQMQYVGKLIRGVDPRPLFEAVAAVQIGHTRESLALHQAERWRAELLASDDALTRFAAEHANADVQQLRAVIRNARKDAAQVPEKRSGRFFRELFRLVKEQAPRGTL